MSYRTPKFVYLLEAIPIHGFAMLFSLLPAKWATALGGFIARTIGPHLAASRKARRHIRKIWPDMADAKVRHIERGMWDNLGRVISEYPHLQKIGKQSECIGLEHVEAARKAGKHLLFVSGHFANWEMNAVGYHNKSGDAISLIYRNPNNPYIGKMLDRMRGLSGQFVTIPKSRAGNRLLLETFRRGDSIGVLIDQKYTEGVAVPFLGFPAMTSTAFVTLAQRYNYAIIPARAVRAPDNSLRSEFYPALFLHDASGAPRIEADVVADLHTMMEGWIVENPSQWIWLHRRWSSRAVVDLPRVKTISEPS